MTTNRVPRGDTARAVQSARPPIGPGPSSRVLFQGLAELRPPLPVLVAGVLMTVPVLGLAVASVAVVVRGFSVGFGQGLFSILFGIILFTLAGLGWRGVKRTVHLGSYDDGFFLARLSLIGLVVAAVALVVLATQGETLDWSFALLPAAVAFLWLPWLLLQNGPARAWPQRVELRRGTRVADVADAVLLPGLRAHTCGAVGFAFPAQPARVVPVHGGYRPGWRVSYTCSACGQPAEQLAMAGEPSGLGGADLWWLGEQADQVCQTAPDASLQASLTAPRTLDDEVLGRAVSAMRRGVRATEQLLDLVPEGKDAVAVMSRAGRAIPAGHVTTAFRRDVVERELSRRRGWLAALETEVQRRAGSAPPVRA
ncbi:hypothetical protein TEK04_13990 [Klenkia sp. LSe6-5]|uniref:Uncharacterized protein n=1 Tax=Klenkia sesuvii TaxID=3103137 RepID=A0ABU8DWI2_9ACTN